MQWFIIILRVMMFRFFGENKDWILLNIPALLMVLGIVINKNLYHDFIVYSGYIATSLLITVLALNPLVSIFKANIFLKKVVQIVQFVELNRLVVEIVNLTEQRVNWEWFLVKKMLTTIQSAVITPFNKQETQCSEYFLL